MIAAYGEGFSLAEGSGIDANQLLEVLKLGVCMFAWRSFGRGVRQ